MADAKAKTINLLLYEGDLEGVISIEDSSWNSGELYSAPRDSVSELLETDACKKYGVYLLLSKSMVYVGQSSDLSKRITQHTGYISYCDFKVICLCQLFIEAFRNGLLVIISSERQDI